MHCGVGDSLSISALEMKLSALKLCAIIQVTLCIILSKQTKGVTSLPSIPRVIMLPLG